MNFVLTGVAMDILTPLALGLGGIIVGLYVLRVRRRRVQVPFSPLWRKVLREAQATNLWQKLKRWISLLLQLLLLALLLLSLGDPRSAGQLEEGRSVVILVDTSASMYALDEAAGRRRIDAAIDSAREVIDGLGARDEVMLVRMDGQLEPLTPFVTDFGLADELVRDLETSATSADIREAFRFAVDSLASRPRGEIVLISDGAFDEASVENFDIEVPTHVNVTWLPIGEQDGNVAITAFNVRRYPSNRTNYEVYVQVRSYVDVPVTVELSIYGEGNLVDSERIDLGPEATELRIYPDIPSSGNHLEARIEIVAGDAVDVFDLDDVAHALLPEDRTTRVLIVSPGSLYLEGPFLLNQSVDATVIRPDDYVATNGGDPSAGYDLTVFDGVAPPISDRGNYLYFSPSGEFSPWTVENDVVDPIIDRSDRSHPLMAYVSALRDLNIARARRLQLDDPNDQVIASAISGAPMIVARDELQRRMAAVAFGVTDSDLPLRVAFPVFLLNAIDWLTGADTSLVDGYRTGESWFIRLSDRTLTEATITRPSGEETVVPAYDGTVVIYGDEIGFYTVEAGDEALEVAGNLSSTEESRIRPAESLTLGDLPIGEEFEAAGLDFEFDAWILLILAAFGLLLLEWATWNRRLTI